jgi:predicted metal-dependent phosphoesterase TrpH
MEIHTPHGDLLVFGLDDMPSLQKGTAAFIHEVNRRNGALVSAHPYRKNDRGFGDAIREFPGIHRVEGYNGNTPYRYNQEAVSLAGQLGIPIVGGSDAHRRPQLGVFATNFPSAIYSEKQLAQALRSGQGLPVMLTADGFRYLTDPVLNQEAV